MWPIYLSSQLSFGDYKLGLKIQTDRIRGALVSQKLIFELTDDQKSEWMQTIQEFRGRYVKAPRDYVSDYLGNNIVRPSQIKKDVSRFINELRNTLWEIYIKDEARFHRKVIAHLISTSKDPSDILSKMLSREVDPHLHELDNKDLRTTLFANLIGDYSGRIMPYLYNLSLSTTNSRRSRAGQTFEAVIDFIMQQYGYPYNSQATLGKAYFHKHGLGKIVDGIIPGPAEYSDNRSKCMIITMKTTLRERWQEVVEEMQRTQIPSIYLLTLDYGISESMLSTVKQHNITIVDYDDVVANFSGHSNIISYSQLFNREIPSILRYWENI